MTSAQIIVLATPVFLGAIGLELVVGLARGRNTYRLHDAVTSIGLGMLSQLVGLFTKLMAIGLYTIVYERVALWTLPADSIVVWLGALLLYDLCYYWLHRAGHRVGILWAAHVVHHQSEDYNLSTALRQTSSGALLGWLFYLPMAVIGVPPLVFGTVALIDLLYQFWVHTQQVGKLGWFDRWFCSPSNHRVHHAVNDRYLDRNYGGVLIVWDRLFGTFEEERDDEPCVYGTRAPLRSFNPLWANLEVYASLARDARRFACEGPFEPGYDPPHTTLQVGTVTGGAALNMIPEQAEFALEWRTIAADDFFRELDRLRAHIAATIEPEMHRLAPESGFGIEVTDWIPGLSLPGDHALATLVRQLTGANDVAKVSFGTEAGLYQQAGIPSIVCGPGFIAQAHQPDEWISRAQLAVCDSFIRRLGGWLAA